MKKILLLIFCCIAFFACNKNSGVFLGEATSVAISKSKVDLLVGETATLTATVLPASLGMSVTWSSLDEEIATVDNGVITAKARGVTYVVATSADGLKKGACMVSVNREILYTIAVKNQSGITLTEIYGFPGQTMQLTPYTSDEQDHELTMTLEDSSVGTLEADGTLTLAAQESTEANLIYDAQSVIKVVSEDGYIHRIPVRSSLYNGIRFNDEFMSSKFSITANTSQNYSIAALYQGVNGPVAIPAEQASLELGNSTDFSLSVNNSAYTLATGTKTDVETSLSIQLSTGAKIKLADIIIEKYFDIKATLVNSTSSTLVFTWTERGTASQDIANAYTATLYKDSECTIVDQSFNFSAELAAWNGNTPKYIFGGLQPGTEYWLKVYDTTNNYESNKVKATTDAFTHVLMPQSITSTGVVLAEDFGEIRWEFDHFTGAVGFTPSDKSDFANTAVAGYNYSGGEEIVFKSCGDAIKNSRLNGWLTDTDGFVHPGYIKLGTEEQGGWMLTPAFTVPEGKKAVVKVTVTAARFNTDQTEEWGLFVISEEKAGVGKDGEHSAYFNWPDLNNNTLYQRIQLDNTDWMTKSAEGLVVHSRDRIAFGSYKEAKENTRRGYLSDMVVEVIEIVEE